MSIVQPHRLGIALAISALACAPRARAEVTQPFPGVTLVRNGGRALAIADLCAPGVRIRATKYGERKKTPEQWATLPGVGAAVAVNADFFDLPATTHTNGRARGGGEDWPASAQMWEFTALGEVRSYWQFGPKLAAHVPQSTTAPSGTATEIVGAHNVIIRDGKSLAPGFDGDGVILAPKRRTSIGVNASRSKVYLFTSNDELSGAVLASTMLAYAKEGGAPDLDIATNEDGGGSSQMYVRGKGQIVTSGRLVANHLGIIATGTGASPMCPNVEPRGALDGADCDRLTGWAQDPDDGARAIAVHFYFDGKPGTPGVHAINGGPAANKREDLCAPLGTCEHGFDVGTPFGLLDGKEHAVYAFAIDTKGGANPEIKGSGRKIACSAKAPRSMRRKLATGMFEAWKFDRFADVLRLTDPEIAALPDAAPISAAPALVRMDGKPEVWLVDGASKHHVPSPAVAAAWHFDLAAVVVKPAAEIDALTTAAPLRPRPWLAQGSGDDVYLLDGVPGEEDPVGGGGSEAPTTGRPPRAEPETEAAAEEGCASAGQRHGRSGDVALTAAAVLALVATRRRARRA